MLCMAVLSSAASLPVSFSFTPLMNLTSVITSVHGTNYRLGHDWSDSRSLSEELARVCLISCLQWAAEHRQANDPRLLSQSK